MKTKILLGLSVLAFASCNTFETDDTEYTNPGSSAGIQEMYTDGQNMDDYYVDISGWENRGKWNLANVHDPSVVLADDGYYYMYQTDASYGNVHQGYGQNRGHFLCRRSKDLVNWQFMGPTMHGVPSWVKTKTNEIHKAMGVSDSPTNFTAQDNFGYWAPCVRKVSSNLYRMYYVITLPGTIDASDSTWSERSYIGMMETSDPSNIDSWVDKGYVVTNYSDKELNFKVLATQYDSCYYKYNAIDPSYIITESGEHWLVYGSWHSGFAAVQINPETGKTMKEQGMPWGAANEDAYGKLIYTRQKNNRWQGSEAPEVVYHDGYYYMFIAYDELSVAYNTRVVRSKNIDGPYVDINGTDVTNNGGEAYPILTHPYKFGTDHGWVGISHCSVFDDGNGNWFYVSQQRFPANYNSNTASNSLMLGGVRSIVWTENGWPLVMPERYGAVEQTAITEADLEGLWENIELSYNYGEQDGSIDIDLAKNHKVIGAPFDGQTWSFDATKNILTIGSTKLYLKRELDWEASPRKSTIVFVGLSSDNKTTYWGKKVG